MKSRTVVVSVESKKRSLLDCYLNLRLSENTPVELLIECDVLKSYC